MYRARALYFYLDVKRLNFLIDFLQKIIYTLYSK